jgi:hypothetical protein
MDEGSVPERLQSLCFLPGRCFRTDELLLSELFLAQRARSTLFTLYILHQPVEDGLTEFLVVVPHNSAENI